VSAPCKQLLQIESVDRDGAVLKLYAGGSLDWVMWSLERTLSAQHTRYDLFRSWLTHIILGIHHMHETWERVHCDLRPANIFATDRTQQRFVIGTPCFLKFSLFFSLSYGKTGDFDAMRRSFLEDFNSNDVPRAPAPYAPSSEQENVWHEYAWDYHTFASFVHKDFASSPNLSEEEKGRITLCASNIVVGDFFNALLAIDQDTELLE
jgi:serine/threonine protein kinase